MMEKMKENEGFFMRPYSFFRTKGRLVTGIESAIKGIAFSMPNCNFGYAKFCEKLGISRSTVARKSKLLQDDPSFDVQRRGGKCSHYEYVGELARDVAHVQTPYYFYTQQWKIHGKMRRLTPAEVDVLALIYTHTRDGGTYKGGVRKIAAIIGHSKSTIILALKELFYAGLIARPKKALNTHGDSEYCVVRSRVRRVERKLLKAEKKAKKAWEPEHVARANARAEFEREQAQRKYDAESLVDARLRHLESCNPAWKDVTRRLNVLEMLIARADVAGDVATLQQYNDEKAHLLAQRSKMLKRCGFTDDDLVPRYNE
jgi:predicted transcriptional regulator